MNIFYDTSDRVNDVGLVRIGDLSEDGLSYEYNMLMVVKHEPSGRIFYGADRGCSCPTPFEEDTFNGPDDTTLSEIKAGDAFTSFQRDVESFPAPQQEREDLVSAVKTEIQNK